MDQPSRPEDATQGAPYPPPAPPPQYPPPAQWPAPAEDLGPAPGVRFASHGGRLVAYIVDVILASILVTIVAVLLSFGVAVFAVAGVDVLAAAGGIFVLVAVVTVSIGYFPWFWVKGGATPGMRIFNLTVVRDRDGGPIGWGEAFLRLFGFWVSSLVFYLGFAWILIDKRRRGWHDLIAGTIMVQPD
ncbi:MAG TPA: RDD family protein [Patescibacteria group bacterium]|nr:RDD family protein [Patescibacteria group bacterium]